MTEPELKAALSPCPFCGSTDIVLQSGSQMPGWDEDVKAHQCRKCGATGPTLYRTRDNEERLGWNSRAALASPIGEGERFTLRPKHVLQSIIATNGLEWPESVEPAKRELVAWEALEGSPSRPVVSEGDLEWLRSERKDREHGYPVEDVQHNLRIDRILAVLTSTQEKGE